MALHGCLRLSPLLEFGPLRLMDRFASVVVGHGCSLNGAIGLIAVIHAPMSVSAERRL